MPSALWTAFSDLFANRKNPSSDNDAASNWETALAPFVSSGDFSCVYHVYDGQTFHVPQGTLLYTKSNSTTEGRIIVEGILESN